LLFLTFIPATTLHFPSQALARAGCQSFSPLVSAVEGPRDLVRQGHDCGLGHSQLRFWTGTVSTNNHERQTIQSVANGGFWGANQNMHFGVPNPRIPSRRLQELVSLLLGFVPDPAQ
jgi:hypothetical protein